MLQIQETSGEFVSQDTPIAMNRGSKEIEIQGNWAVNRLGDRRRDWISNFKYRDNDDLEEAGFNEDCEYGDIGDYEYVDDDDYDHGDIEPGRNKWK